MPFIIKTVTDFAAAHSLRGYDGPCQRLHGHNWKVEMEVVATQLDEIGMAVDFKVVKDHTKAIMDRLDHHNLNEIAPFDSINPTAENLAQYFYQQMAERLAGSNARIQAVTIWETERACARYEEE